MPRSLDRYYVGDRVIWYDCRIWHLVGHDVGDNSWCRMPGTVVKTSHDEHGQTVDICFDHDGFVSRGHFAWKPYGGEVFV